MPIPEKHVFVCTQARPPGHPRSSCADRNCGEVFEEFMWQLQNRPDLFGKVLITATGCIGPCSEGPTVLVYPEAFMYGGVKKDDVGRIFDEHLVGNAPIQSLKMSEEFWG